MYKRILIATDGSPLSDKAVEHGLSLAALTGATVAALTVYDMCKALSHAIVLGPAKLVGKRGGKRDVGAP